MINNHVPINFKLKAELTEGEEEIRSNLVCLLLAVMSKMFLIIF